jgi:hypothetical protein
VNHGVADEDETAAHSLEKARDKELLNGSGKRHHQRRQQKQRIAYQDEFALADVVGKGAARLAALFE